MKTQSVFAMAFVSTFAATSPAIAQDRSDWPDNFTVGTASQGEPTLRMGPDGQTLSPRTWAYPVVLKLPVVRCRIWRWFILAI